MKRIVFAAGCFLLVITCKSQVKEGKITYERIFQLSIQVADDNPAMQHMIPRERKDKFELLFSNNQSLWRPVEDDNQSDEMNFGDGGGARMIIRMPGSEDIVYHNIGEIKRVEQRELGGKTFIVNDSIRRLNWKLTGETKTILGYKCMKATSWRTQESYRMQMNNGNASRERVTDTLNIVAWFTNEIPGSYGPENYQGQLPGTILEIDINNGRTMLKAIDFSAKVDLPVIKEPTKGKKLTPEEFAKEREKLFKEMQERGGGQRTIIRGGL